MSIIGKLMVVAAAVFAWWMLAARHRGCRDEVARPVALSWRRLVLPVRGSTAVQWMG